jgi:TolB-like protein
LENAGQLVTREQLQERLWPSDTFVEFDGSLNAALKRLRLALGDSADNPIFIETVPRQGYRFIAPVSYGPNPGSVETVQFAALSPARLEPQAGEDVSSRHPWRGVPWVAAAVVIALGLLGARFLRKGLRISAPPTAIAVMPFANQGAGTDLDYLRYMIANELVTDLTHARSLAVRPFASTSRYATESVDPATVGRDLRVTYVLDGGYLLIDGNLRVSMELVDVANNKAVWRDELSVSPHELMNLRNQLTTRAVPSLLPVLHVSGGLRDVPAPTNERAFVLYSHSLSISNDPIPNLEGIQLLEQSVALDPGYAPAWNELTWRYYVDSAYGNGGDKSMAKCLDAHQHWAQLDPDGIANTITLKTERGQLNAAYDEALSLLQRRPDSSAGPFEMSYVLRYAGRLDEARKQCEEALAIDPGFSPFRSCATPFILSGDYEHAQKYIRLDENSGFGAALRTEIALRTGDMATAIKLAPIAAQSGFAWAKLVPPCLQQAQPTDVGKIASELEADPRAARDAEPHYRNAAALSFCGQTDAAVRELHNAIAGGYCSYPAMDQDPLLKPIREVPDFQDLRQQGKACQASFEAHRRQVGGASNP